MKPDIVKNLPPAPGDVMEWIQKDCVKKGWMFYSKKEDRARCSRCGETMSLGWFEGMTIDSGRQAECPNCGSKVEFRPEGIGRKKLTEQFRVMICTPDGEDIVITVSEVDAAFEKPGPPTVYRTIRQVLQFSEKGCENWFYNLPYYSMLEGYVDGWWEKKKTMFLYTPGRFGWYGSKFDEIHLYHKNLWTLNVGSFRYADIDDYTSFMELTPKELIKYMNLCIRYPQSEKLRKFGCNNLIMGYIDDNGPKTAVNWKGKTIPKMLRCDMRAAREIRDFDAGLNTLRVYQKLRKEGFRISVDAAELWEKTENMDEKQRELLSPKIAQYLADQNRAYRVHNRLSDYIDYFHQCKELEYDWNRKKNRFPVNFAKTHRELSKKLDERKKAIDEEKYRKAVGVLYHSAAGQFEDGEFCIRIPATGEEIREEGRKQHHCVGGYVDKVLRHDCFIVFLRKKEEPDQPFYTVELSIDLKIRQCRGLRNCSMTPEVETFVQKWTAAMETEKKNQEKNLKKVV